MTDNKSPEGAGYHVKVGADEYLDFSSKWKGDHVTVEPLIRLSDHEASRAADKARIADLEADQAKAVTALATLAEALHASEDMRNELLKDKARLDFLDRMNQILNTRYGTNYKWTLILSPNITRLMLGAHWNGYVGDVDLNDAVAFGEPSCRDAIDATLAKLGGES